ncbi:TolC family protein [Acidovorax sp. DW039]|uniref:TolC family protein n=1 Tax=Acidovorax sp. DW039 TaxID=3095606 RepID=UPI003092CF63|nr:TolC family protein [Acidovorax sp. DW039]
MFKRNDPFFGDGRGTRLPLRSLVAVVIAMLGAAAAAAPASDTSGQRPASLQPAATSPGSASQTIANTPLTLAQAVDRALQTHGDVAAAQRLVEATQGQVVQGSVRPNPELAYSLEDTRFATRSQSWQLNLPLELGGKRRARIAAAERAREQAHAQWAAVRATLQADVGTAYFDALAAQERLALARDSAALAKLAADAVGKRVSAGKVSPVEETKARVAEAGVWLELAQAASDERNALTRLRSLVGLAPSAPLTLVSTGDAMPWVPPLNALQETAESAPTLVQARLEVDRRQALTAVEQSKRVPDITVSAGVKRANDAERNVVLLGVSIPLPMFDRNQGNLLEALRLEDKARDELQAARIRFGSELMQAHDRLSTLAEEARLLQTDVLPGAKSAYDAATLGFDNGKFSFLEVLDAQRTYFTAKAQFLKTLADAHRAAADIDRLLGRSASAPLNPPLQ